MTHSPLLLLHGALGAREQLFPLRDRFAGEREVHVFNFSGHGGEPFAEDFGTMQFVEETLRYLEIQELGPVDIFGYSMGGFIALSLARLRPDRVRRIFTLGTKFHWTPDTAAAEAERLDPTVIEARTPDLARTLAERHTPHDWKELLAATIEMMLDLGDRNLLPPSILGTIPHPVLVARGGVDRMVTHDESFRAANALHHGRFLTLPDMPHPIEKVEMDLLEKELRKFLE